MFADFQTMEKIHSIQLEMLGEFLKVMDKMNLKYYFVHGSLLGSVIKESFIIEDDDIDIAMPRQDYDRFIDEGQKFLPNKYFIQSSITDDYPLPFSKLRNSETAFIQPILKYYKCNQGIYIDIFPIDFAPESRIEQLYENLLNLRVFSKLRLTEKRTFKSRLLQLLLVCIFPSYSSSVNKREMLCRKRKACEFVRLTGGKNSEKKIPISWFGDGINFNFCGYSVICPIKYSEYLTQIYGGDYFNINPAANRIEEEKVELSCNILDLNHSYSNYIL